MLRNRWRNRLGATRPPAPLRLAPPPPTVADEFERGAQAAAIEQAAAATMPTGVLIGELERRGTKRSLAGHLPPEDRIRLVRLLDQALMLLGEQTRTCHRCGCTDDAACVGGCTWVDVDLCSACRPTDGAAAVRQAVDELRALRVQLEQAMPSGQAGV